MGGLEKTLWEIGSEPRSFFDKAPLIADSTLKPTFVSPTVKAPDPSPERGGSRDAQDRADQLHVPPANPDRGL